jgi:uncharacterized protein
MNTTDVIMARVYMTEGEHRLAEFLQLLHDELKVKGVTVFRGITGFGKSGKMHSSNLLDVSMDLPLVVEFFDVPERMTEVLDRIKQDFEPGHIVNWSARVNI